MNAPDFNLLIEQLKAAHALQKSGAVEQALVEYEKLLSVLPGFPDLLFFKATALDSLGRHAEALPCIEQAVKAKSGDANYAFHYAKILHGLGQDDKAQSILQSITQQLPSYRPAWYLLGCISETREKFPDAAKNFHQALTLDSNDLPSLVGYSWALHRLGRTPEAIPLLQNAISRGAPNAVWLNSLGIMYKGQRNMPQAEEAFKKAIAINPKLYGAYNNLSSLYTDHQRFDEAHAVLNAAIAEGDAGMSRYYKCMLYFLENDIEKALPLWEARWQHEDVPATTWPFPKWDGTPLNGKKLLVWGEQGIGDELMFASLLPDHLEQYPNTVLVCQKRLLPIFSRSFTCEVFPRSEKPYQEICARTDIAAHCPIGDLLLYCKPRKSYPVHQGYLKADDANTSMFKQKHKVLPNRLKVGISWASSNYATGGVRTVPLEQWLPLLRTPDVDFISVQYGNFQSEVEAFARTHQVALHWDKDVDAMMDMDALASQMASLDLVISIANSTVHMAGSLGVPVWVMVPEVPSWRWTMTRDDTLWYSHIRLFRQQASYEWADVIDAMVKALPAFKP